MARCGCNDEAVVVQAGKGIKVEEETQINLTTYTVSFDGTQVVGPGLLWDPQAQRLQVKLAATDPGLAFDGTGGLYNTRDGSETPRPSFGATVAALEARQAQQDVVAGALGAGYMIKPAGTRGSVEYGVQRGIDAMHLPVRMLYDGTPVVAYDERVGQHTNIASQYVLDQDVQRWRIVQNEPGLWYPDFQNEQEELDPQRGWFGYLERNETGLLSLADVFDIVGNSAVLLLQLAFPAFDRSSWTWTSERPPTPQQIDRFLDRLRVLIQRYGLTDSVVVMSTTPHVPDGAGGNRPVLDPFTNVSIRSGPVLTSPEDAEYYQLDGDNWSAAWTWAVCDLALPNETIQTYTQGGIHTLISTVQRQYLHQMRVVPSGALGVVSADPEYYAGQLPSHPTASNYAYRKARSTWVFNTIDNGVLPPNDAPGNEACAFRGLLRREPEGPYGLGPAMWQTNGAPYYVLQGWLCPIAADSYTLEFAIHPLTIPAGGYAAVAFCVNTDHAFRNWQDGAPDQSGYIFTYDSNRRMAIHSWDEAQGTIVERAGVDASGLDDDRKLFNIVISPTELRIRFLNKGDGSVIAEIPEGDPPDWALQWRGKYVFLGQYAPEQPPADAVPLTYYDLGVKNAVSARSGPSWWTR